MDTLNILFEYEWDVPCIEYNDMIIVLTRNKCAVFEKTGRITNVNTCRSFTDYSIIIRDENGKITSDGEELPDGDMYFNDRMHGNFIYQTKDKKKFFNDGNTWDVDSVNKYHIKSTDDEDYIENCVLTETIHVGEFSPYDVKNFFWFYDQDKIIHHGYIDTECYMVYISPDFEYFEKTAETGYYILPTDLEYFETGTNHYLIVRDDHYYNLMSGKKTNVSGIIKGKLVYASGNIMISNDNSLYNMYYKNKLVIDDAYHYYFVSNRVIMMKNLRCFSYFEDSTGLARSSFSVDDNIFVHDREAKKYHLMRVSDDFIYIDGDSTKIMDFVMGKNFFEGGDDIIGRDNPELCLDMNNSFVEQFLNYYTLTKNLPFLRSCSIIDYEKKRLSFGDSMPKIVMDRVWNELVSGPFTIENNVMVLNPKCELWKKPKMVSFVASIIKLILTKKINRSPFHFPVELLFCYAKREDDYMDLAKIKSPELYKGLMKITKKQKSKKPFIYMDMEYDSYESFVKEYFESDDAILIKLSKKIKKFMGNFYLSKPIWFDALLTETTSKITVTQLIAHTIIHDDNKTNIARIKKIIKSFDSHDINKFLMNVVGYISLSSKININIGNDADGFKVSTCSRTITIPAKTLNSLPDDEIKIIMTDNSNYLNDKRH